jgi:hypothetical protein
LLESDSLSSPENPRTRSSAAASAQASISWDLGLAHLVNERTGRCCPAETNKIRAPLAAEQLFYIYYSNYTTKGAAALFLMGRHPGC